MGGIGQARGGRTGAGGAIPIYKTRRPKVCEGLAALLSGGKVMRARGWTDVADVATRVEVHVAGKWAAQRASSKVQDHPFVKEGCVYKPK